MIIYFCFFVIFWRSACAVTVRADFLYLFPVYGYCEHEHPVGIPGSLYLTSAGMLTDSMSILSGYLVSFKDSCRDAHSFLKENIWKNIQEKYLKKNIRKYFEIIGDFCIFALQIKRDKNIAALCR